MKRLHKAISIAQSVVLCFVMVFSAVAPSAAQKPDGPDQPQQGEGIRYGYNEATGKLSFVGADPAAPIKVTDAPMVGANPSGAGLAFIAPYAQAFGLKDPARDLQMLGTEQVGRRSVLRYQQTYQGIPVMAGEMVVNVDSRNRLLSLNGEIAPDLSLSTEPAIPSQAASETALGAVAKWYQLESGDFTASEPALWIYDSRLFTPDTYPPALVWRMEVRSVDGAIPVNELVLVDARTGGIRLHFNQIDTSWGGFDAPAVQQAGLQVDGPTLTPTATPTETSEPSMSEATSEPVPQGLVGAGPGTILYVATTGSDGTNNCLSLATPCATIHYALGKATGGETIKVAAGTYTTGGDLYSLVIINSPYAGIA